MSTMIPKIMLRPIVVMKMKKETWNKEKYVKSSKLFCKGCRRNICNNNLNLFPSI